MTAAAAKAHNKSFSSEEIDFVCKNSDIFPFIFDAAAMGQYLGGVDPRNTSANTIGFVNEGCAIRYDRNRFEWETIDGIRRPFLVIDAEDGEEVRKIPIFNLHIHCKRVSQFM